MPIKVTCSNCGGVLHAPDDAGGKRGRCPTCGNILPIPAETPRASASSLPDAPAPKGPARSPSFGDFAIGPQVGPPPGGDPVGSTAAARSSIPGLGDATPAEQRRASMPAMGAKAEPRRATDPFARTGSATNADGQPSSGVVKAWQRAKSGLGWVAFAVFLFLIPAVTLPGKAIAEHFTKQPLLSDAEFPVMKLPQSTAIPLLVAVVPVLLGLIVLLIGRLGFSNVPRRACAKGPALLSVLATIVVLGGVFAICFPSVAFLFTKDPPPVVAEQPAAAPGGEAGTAASPSLKMNEAMPLDLFPSNDPSGLIQRFGFLLGAAMLLVGEFWFASAIGRVGAHLSDAPTAGRATRYLMLLGLAVVVAIGVVGLAPTAFGFGSTAQEMAKDNGGLIAEQWRAYVTPQLDKLGEYRPILVPSVFLGAGLLLGIIYFRLVGAPRRAIREWLDRNGIA